MIVGIVLMALMGVIGLQLVRLNSERIFLAEKAGKLKREMDALKAENEKVQSDLAYFSNSKNLEKEIRSLLNYKKAGEEVYVVVPHKNQQ